VSTVTRSFSDLVLNMISQAMTNDPRSVQAVALFCGIWLTVVCLVFFNDDALVTQYSLAVFDAFMNQTKVSSSFRQIHVGAGTRIHSQLWGERLWALDKNVTLTLNLKPFRRRPLLPRQQVCIST